MRWSHDLSLMRSAVHSTATRLSNLRVCDLDTICLLRRLWLSETSPLFTCSWFSKLRHIGRILLHNQRGFSRCFLCVATLHTKFESIDVALGALPGLQS